MIDKIKTDLAGIAAILAAAPGMIWAAAHTPAFYYGLGGGIIAVTAAWHLHDIHSSKFKIILDAQGKCKTIYIDRRVTRGDWKRIKRECPDLWEQYAAADPNNKN